MSQNVEWHTIKKSRLSLTHAHTTHTAHWVLSATAERERESTNCLQSDTEKLNGSICLHKKYLVCTKFRMYPYTKTRSLICGIQIFSFLLLSGTAHTHTHIQYVVQYTKAQVRINERDRECTKKLLIDSITTTRTKNKIILSSHCISNECNEF